MNGESGYVTKGCIDDDPTHGRRFWCQSPHALFEYRILHLLMDPYASLFDLTFIG